MAHVVKSDSFTVSGSSDRGITGCDTFIRKMPSSFYLPTGGNGVIFAAVQFSQWLRGVAFQQAEDSRQVLHHGEYVITADPSVLQSWGLFHDCDDCREMVLSALDLLDQEPEQKMLVGTLYWAER